MNSSEQNTEQTAEQESSVYRQSYVNDEHHNADDVSGNGTYYSQGSNNSSNDSTQNGSYYNSNSNNSQNNGYYYSTNDSQTNNGYNYNSNNNNNGNGKKKKKKRTLIAVVAVCVVLLAGTIGISAAYISKNKDSLTNVLEDGTLSNKITIAIVTMTIAVIRAITNQSAQQTHRTMLILHRHQALQ